MPNFFNLVNKKSKSKKTLDQYAEDALYREVWEEVHAQKTYALFRKYTRHLIIASVIILLSVIGWQIWRNANHNAKIAAANTYEIAADNSDAKALAALSDNASGATADLALFQSYLIDGDVKKIEKLAKDGETRDFRDLAKIHVAGIKGDSMSAPEFEKFLSDLDTKKSPFYYKASLLVAQKYLSVGDKESAKKWLDKILNDDKAPNIISATAGSLK